MIKIWEKIQELATSLILAPSENVDNIIGIAVGIVVIFIFIFAFIKEWPDND